MSRWLEILATLALAASLPGCMSVEATRLSPRKQPRPQRNPDSLAIYTPDTIPDRPFEAIALIETDDTWAMSGSTANHLKKIREKAGELGADAVIFVDAKNGDHDFVMPATGQAAWNNAGGSASYRGAQYVNWDYRVLTAYAVVWTGPARPAAPARAPEPDPNPSSSVETTEPIRATEAREPEARDGAATDAAGKAADTRTRRIVPIESPTEDVGGRTEVVSEARPSLDHVVLAHETIGWGEVTDEFAGSDWAVSLTSAFPGTIAGTVALSLLDAAGASVFSREYQAVIHPGEQRLQGQVQVPIQDAQLGQSWSIELLDVRATGADVHDPVPMTDGYARAELDPTSVELSLPPDVGLPSGTTLTVRCLVKRDGSVAGAKVLVFSPPLQGNQPELRAAIAASARRYWRFSPARTALGLPVSVWQVVSIDWTEPEPEEAGEGGTSQDGPSS